VLYSLGMEIRINFAKMIFASKPEIVYPVLEIVFAFFV